MFTSDYSQPITSNWSLEDMVALGQNYDTDNYAQYNNNLFITPNSQLPLSDHSNPIVTSAPYSFDPVSTELMNMSQPDYNSNLSALLPSTTFDHGTPNAMAESIALDSESRDYSTSPSELPEPIKLKPGRKRKDEKVDREALKRDRMIRNRLAAQRSRERKRKEVISVEKENLQLKDRNKELETRVSTLEASNLALMERLDALSRQMQAMQGQMQMNNLGSVLFNRFGETAALVDRGFLPRSQQRKRLNQYLVLHYQMLLAMQTMLRIYFLVWWTTRLWVISSISNGPPLTEDILCLITSEGDEFNFHTVSKYLAKLEPTEIEAEFKDFDLKARASLNFPQKWLPP